MCSSDLPWCPSLSLSLPLSLSLSLSSPPLLVGFRISQVQLADSGVFTCVASSAAGVADRNFTLQVHGTEQGSGLAGPLALGARIKALVPSPLPIWVKPRDGPQGCQGRANTQSLIHLVTHSLISQVAVGH